MLTLSVRRARLSVYLSVSLSLCVCSLVCVCMAVCLCPFRLSAFLRRRRLVMYQQLKIFSSFSFFCVLFATFSFLLLALRFEFSFLFICAYLICCQRNEGGEEKRDLGQAAPVGPRCLWCFLYALFCLPCGAYWSRRRALRTGAAANYP